MAESMDLKGLDLLLEKSRDNRILGKKKKC